MSKSALSVSFQKEASNTDVAIVVGVFSNAEKPDDKSIEMSSAAQFLNDTTNGLIQNAIDTNRFKGNVGDVISIVAPNDLKVRRLIVVGFGQKDKFSKKVLQDIGGHIYAAVAATPDQEAVIHLSDLAVGSLGKGDVAALMASGVLLRSWRMDKYFTKQKDDEKPQLTKLTVITEDPESATLAFAPLKEVCEGVFLCREFQTEPCNIIYPETYAERIKDELKPYGVTVEILGEKEMKKLGMGCLLGVGQGSAKESKMVVMTYNGGPKDQDPIAFIGKGVTFDTGGISLKPGANMHEMKYDMSGSASVVGVMRALAGRKAKVNVVAAVGLVENMPDGDAIRPGDVLTSMSGQTVEVLNTDAEGRLVLCDVLWYMQDRFKPQFMIDLATLTGAIVISLGDLNAGLFSNNDNLAGQLADASEKSGDPLWRQPLSADYDKLLKSPIADMQNISNGRMAGSITAAQYLQRFVNNVPWAHLDIAGVAWIDGRQLPTAQKGATGYGVRLLDQLVTDHYEA